MKNQMEPDREALLTLLDQQELTAGMRVRIHGDHLILGRDQASASDQGSEMVESVRLTRLSSFTYSLGVKRHTGRWERTPFSGSIEEMVEVMLSLMPHLIAPW